MPADDDPDYVDPRLKHRDPDEVAAEYERLKAQHTP